MTAGYPSLILIGGPNGAGKSTIAPVLLRDELSVMDFVNADVIAQGLSGFAAEGAAIAAGRVMLLRIHDLMRQRLDLAFESTLSTRTFVPLIHEAREAGYRIVIQFLWLSGPDIAVRRVQKRMELGGHGIPEETIRRRYPRGIENFFRLYLPLADAWRFSDNTDLGGPRLIARGGLGSDPGHHRWRDLEKSPTARVRDRIGSPISWRRSGKGPESIWPCVARSASPC